MNEEAIGQAFSAFVGLEVVVLGDVMVDSYMMGKVSRISPEAPIPVVQITSRENRLGGAANVALNLQALGARPLLCSVIGTEVMGDTLVSLMAEKDLDTTGILRSSNRQTTVKTRVISSNQHLLRVDEETLEEIAGEEEERILTLLKSWFATRKISALIFQDYNKGVLSYRLIPQVISLCRTYSVRTLVDPKRRNFFEYQGVDLFKPNFREFTEGIKEDLKRGDLEGLHEIGRAFRLEMNIGILMVTLSEHGVYVCSGFDYHHLKAHIRDIADVSGAGDTVISVAALCLSTGFDASDLAVWSNLAGGLVCEKVGVVPIDKMRLVREVREYYLGRQYQ